MCGISTIWRKMCGISFFLFALLMRYIGTSSKHLTFQSEYISRYLFYGCYSTPGIMQLSSLRASLVNLFLLFSTSLDLSLR